MYAKRIQTLSQLFERDGRNCVFCQKELNWRTATLDHIVPKCRGGRLLHCNIAVACKRCNERRPSRSHTDFLNTMRAHGRPESEVRKFSGYIAQYFHDNFLKVTLEYIRSSKEERLLNNKHALLKYFGSKRALFINRSRHKR